MSISVFSVVYFSIDVARGEQTIANTPPEQPKTKFPLSMRLPDPRMATSTIDKTHACDNHS
jgi:hypothetical protein